MATPEQQQEILSLRERQLTPKQIARKLGLRPAEVKAVIKAGAIETESQRLARGEQGPLIGCWCDGGTYDILFNPKGKELEDEKRSEGGLSIVTVIRSVRPPRCQVAVYLVDYQCLGVKNALPLRSISESGIASTLALLYEAYPEEPEPITLAQAQALVLGGEQYGKSLGFDPHPDFEEVRDFLGEWDGEVPFEFGYKGEPLYIQGPDDDAGEIIRTLEKNVGKGKFDYLLVASDLSFEQGLLGF